MRNTFLVPLDGTPISEAGLSWAESAALKSGVALRLLGVIENSSEHERLVSALSYVDQQAERLRKLGIRAHGEIKLGSPAQRILEEAEHAQITVLTSGTTRWIFSPVLDQVLRTIATPVVLVRGDRSDWSSVSNFERILLPVSQSNYSSDVIPFVKRLAMMFGSEVVLLHSVEPETDSPFGAITTKRLDVDLRQAEEYVEQVARDFRAGGVNIRPVVAPGKPAEKILAVGREYGAGLIAMATRGRDRLASRFTGSVANMVLETTSIPCLLLRAAVPAHASALSEQAAASSTEDSVPEAAA